MTPDQALGQARFHHQWKPNQLLVEKALGRKCIDSLIERGHKVKIIDSMGAAQSLGQNGMGVFIGSADPRGRGVFSVFN
jgi:gamma-glutamyltranspeptidase/glutathione hydrolase